jgi:hypothetical protein
VLGNCMGQGEVEIGVASALIVSKNPINLPHPIRIKRLCRSSRSRGRRQRHPRVVFKTVLIRLGVGT